MHALFFFFSFSFILELQEEGARNQPIILFLVQVRFQLTLHFPFGTILLGFPAISGFILVLESNLCMLCFFFFSFLSPLFLAYFKILGDHETRVFIECGFRKQLWLSDALKSLWVYYA